MERNWTTTGRVVVSALCHTRDDADSLTADLVDIEDEPFSWSQYGREVLVRCEPANAERWERQLTTDIRVETVYSSQDIKPAG